MNEEKTGQCLQSGTYPWSFVTQIFHSGQPSHGGDRKFSKVVDPVEPSCSLFYIVFIYSWTCKSMQCLTEYMTVEYNELTDWMLKMLFTLLYFGYMDAEYMGLYNKVCS